MNRNHGVPKRAGLTKIANRDASKFVDAFAPFKGSNVFAHNSKDGNWYVVYSYGYHFPMYAYDRLTGHWYVNSDSYSVSTSKHQSQCKPWYMPKYHVKTTQELRSLIGE